MIDFGAPVGRPESGTAGLDRPSISRTNQAEWQEKFNDLPVGIRSHTWKRFGVRDDIFAFVRSSWLAIGTQDLVLALYYELAIIPSSLAPRAIV